MYIWKINALKEQIATGQQTEKDRFIYCLIYVTLSVVGMESMSHIPVENPNMWDMTYSIGISIITFFGTMFAYKFNGGANGVDFLGRYFSIGFVVTIRFLVLLIPAFLALILYSAYLVPEDEEIYSTPIEIILFLIWAVILYWRICKHISDVRMSQQIAQS